MSCPYRGVCLRRTAFLLSLQHVVDLFSYFQVTTFAMRYHLGIEDMEPNHWIAYVFDLPGCYSAAETQEGASLLAPARIAEYFAWRSQHGRPSPFGDVSIQTKADEVFRSFPDKDDPAYIVNAFFKDDRRPLTRAEIDDALWLLEQTRADLLAVVQPLAQDKLKARFPEKRFKTILSILRHVAGAEWWYFDRLGLAFPHEQLAKDPFAALEQVRAQTVAQLPKLVGDTQVGEQSGELWSVRKVVRRALWHERDHTQHIAKLANV
jgi:predicted RNase H-like HicB family nuclease